MPVTEVTTQGWFSRIMESIKGVVVGLIFFVAAFPLLWWNEGRSVQTYKSLTEGRGAVVAAQADSVNPGNESALVHVTGLATTTDTLEDATFGIRVTAIQLSRDVEMYQWIEDVETKTKKRAGGKQETTKTYSYRMDWRSGRVDSSSFHQPQDHQNPQSPFSSDSWRADNVTLGAYSLSGGLTSQISASEPIAISQATLAQVPGQLGRRLSVYDGRFYQGGDASNPQVGDVRISFNQVRPTDVSVIARQSSGTLTGYQTKSGDVLEMLSLGHVPADQMFQAAESANKMLTWVLRVVGFVLMAMGIGLVFRPLSVFADVIPLIGDIIGMGIGVLAFAVAAPLSLGTIGLAWVFYRPVLGVALLAAALGIIVIIKSMASKRRAAAAAPAPPPPPPPVPA